MPFEQEHHHRREPIDPVLNEGHSVIIAEDPCDVIPTKWVFSET